MEKTEEASIVGEENVLGKYAWFKPSQAFIAEWSELSKKMGETPSGLLEPHAVMLEIEKEIVLRMELPGVRKEDISVNATEDRLDVCVQEEYEEEKKEPGQYVYRCRYGGFRGSYLTPCGIDTGDIKAAFRDGILEIRAKKSGEDRRKRIEVE